MRLMSVGGERVLLSHFQLPVQTVDDQPKEERQQKADDADRQVGFGRYAEFVHQSVVDDPFHLHPTGAGGVEDEPRNEASRPLLDRSHHQQNARSEQHGSRKGQEHGWSRTKSNSS